MTGTLRTFCHISEYDEAGYRQLHRLIAASDPLVLWAPSSQFLSDPDISRVSSRDFLEFVEKGQVQVVAREPWLDSPSFRDSHGWPGARWNRYVDDALRTMFREDEREPDLRRRRVAAAPDEIGRDRAERTIEEQPEVAAEIVAALSDENREFEIPPGTLATAARNAENPFDKAEVVLRDAHNHADAIGLTEAETAILLGPGDGVFSQQVAAIFVDEVAVEHGQANDGSTTVTAAQLSSQLVDLLALLETLGPAPDLRSFMVGKGHEELVAWSRGVIDSLTRTGPTELRAEMVAQLRIALERGAFPRGTGDIRFAGGGALIVETLNLLKGTEPLGLFGLAFAIYPLLKRAAEARDLTDAEYIGTQWPFRYLWGSGARHGRHTQLVELVDFESSSEPGR